MVLGKRKRGASGPTRRVRRRTVPKAVKRYVKSAIHRNIENKEIVRRVINQALVTGLSGSVSPYTYSFLPDIPEGAEFGERVGNQVTPRMCSIKAQINLLPYQSSTNPFAPIMVRIWVVSYKLQNRNTVTLNLNDFDRFFEDGNDSIGFQGNMLDMMMPVNKHDWTVHTERKFKLGVSSNNTGSTYSNNTTAPDNGSFARSINLNVSKKLRAKLKYDDGSVTRPTNRNMYMVVQAVRMDGGTGTALTSCEIHFSHRFVFEDA